MSGGWRRWIFQALYSAPTAMSDLKESQALSNSKAEEYEVFQDDDEFEEFEEGTENGRIQICGDSFRSFETPY